MRIIVKKVRREQRKNWRGRWRRTAAFIGAAAAALSAVRWAVDETSVNVAADARIFVSINDRSSAKMPAVEAMELELLPQAKSGGNEPAINSRDSLTVDDELDDLLLDEEIDSGVSASYNGKLDVPSNVRLDRLDFGSDFVKPLRKARVTSRFDYRVNPVTGRYVFHTGMDLGAAQGSDIMAMKSGRVVSAKYNGGYGNVVIIEHSDGIRTLYAHCSKLLVKAGEKVRKGQVIARVGSTGNSTGPHLHIEFRKGGKRYDPEWVIGGIYN